MISVRQFGTLLLLLSAIALLQPPCNSLTFTASGHVRDFYPIDIEHAEHTTKAVIVRLLLLDKFPGCFSMYRKIFTHPCMCIFQIARNAMKRKKIPTYNVKLWDCSSPAETPATPISKKIIVTNQPKQPENIDLRSKLE